MRLTASVETMPKDKVEELIMELRKILPHTKNSDKVDCVDMFCDAKELELIATILRRWGF